ncbi:hypothetical protein [Nostoc sp.]|uniref:hypothetical protein n=1 Tax=Nostoc sp. TaxID=1180 RepID=UPI002FFBF28D
MDFSSTEYRFCTAKSTLQNCDRTLRYTSPFFIYAVPPIHQCPSLDQWGRSLDNLITP